MISSETREFFARQLSTGGQAMRIDALLNMPDVWLVKGYFEQVTPLDAPENIPRGGHGYHHWTVKR